MSEYKMVDYGSVYEAILADNLQMKARIAELEAQLANMTHNYKSVLALNKRNVEDAVRHIRSGDAAMELAYLVIDDLGKKERKIAKLEKQLAEMGGEANE